MMNQLNGNLTLTVAGLQCQRPKSCLFGMRGVHKPNFTEQSRMDIYVVPPNVYTLRMLRLKSSSLHHRYLMNDGVIDSSNLMPPLLRGNQLTKTIPFGLS